MTQLLSHTLTTICGTTACRPDLPHDRALTALLAGLVDPWLGPLSCTEVQLCPQNHGVLTVDRLQSLHDMAPSTRFRFHANVRILGPSRRSQDASRVDGETLPYYEALGRLCETFQMPAYTLHAGLRDRCSRERLVDHLHRLQSLFPCPVGLEPMYPAPGAPYLLDSWEDLRWLLDQDLPYALDLSHLHILATHRDQYDESLTYALLTSPRCLEIHLSDNDGRRDRHRPLSSPPWWWPVFVAARATTSSPTVFSEGNHALPA